MTVPDLPYRPAGTAPRSIAGILSDFDTILEFLDGDLPGDNLADNSIPNIALQLGTYLDSPSGSETITDTSFNDIDGWSITVNPYGRYLVWARLDYDWISGPGFAVARLVADGMLVGNEVEIDQITVGTNGSILLMGETQHLEISDTIKVQLKTSAGGSIRALVSSQMMALRTRQTA